MEMNKRQKLKLKSVAMLDTMEANFPTVGGSGFTPMGKKSNKNNKISYQID
jgi:hypothetical protein